MMAYPTDLDSFTSPTGASQLTSPDHADLHARSGTAVTALEQKVGVGSGTPTIDKALIGSGNGTSSWTSTWNNAILGTPAVTGGTVNNGTFGTPFITGGTVNNTKIGTIQQGSDATGDMYYRDSSGAFTRLAIGTNGQVITTNGTIPSWGVSNNSSDGWTSDSHTWTYASASTFTIAGVDLTSTFTKGTKLKFTQTTTKYAVVVSSSFSTDTTVTIAVNTDYTIANAAITSPYYSYQANPQGWPGWFAYTPSYTGFSANPTAATQFCVVDHVCFVNHITSGAGTSNATTFTITVPIAANTTSNTTNNYFNIARAQDNGTEKTTAVANFASSTILNLYTAAPSTAWTNSGNKFAQFTIAYAI